ncbi:MAG TPA: DUF2227 family putative metal-binding protein [Candidatus Rhabdochlamydia sp.]|jgi:uncharacterized metal-binding protein|nr:DUF2227 family putative metal-binding protein [Candidatus Rhabdochlamydia sp.]
MANYKIHTGFNLFLMLPILIGLGYYFLQPSEKALIIFTATFIYATLFMSPDLDLVHKIKLFSLRGLLTLPFRGYSKIFKHRGISHSLLLGSFTRIIWLSSLLFLFSFSFSFSENLLSFYKHFKTYFIYALIGICLADWSHLLLDVKKTRKIK